jgi:murein DD-endopeptidase MepM/ murein hydrolase activator NlpD
LEKRAINRYRLPVPKNLLERIDRTSSPAHAGNLRNAIDFIVPENTPVLAAAIGLVTYVKDDSSMGRPNPIYWNLQILLQSGMRMKNIQRTIIRHLKAQKSKYANLSARTNSWRDFDSISV